MAVSHKNTVLLNHKFNELVEKDFTGDEIDAFYGILALFNAATTTNNKGIRVNIEDLESRAYLKQKNRNYRPKTFYTKLVEKLNNNIYNIKTKEYVKFFDVCRLDWDNRELLIKIAQSSFEYLYNGTPNNYFTIYLNLLKNATGRRAKRLYRLIEKWESKREFVLSVDKYMEFVCAEVDYKNRRFFWSLFNHHYFIPVVSRLGSSFKSVDFRTGKRKVTTAAGRQTFFVLAEKFKEAEIRADKNERQDEYETYLYRVTGDLKTRTSTLTMQVLEDEKLVESMTVTMDSDGNLTEKENDIENTEVFEFVQKEEDVLAETEFESVDEPSVDSVVTALNKLAEITTPDYMKKPNQQVNWTTEEQFNDPAYWNNLEDDYVEPDVENVFSKKKLYKWE